MKVCIEIKVDIYTNLRNIKTCNGGKGWGDCCTYLNEYSSFCDLFRKVLLAKSKGFRQSFKCDTCLKAIKENT